MPYTNTKEEKLAFYPKLFEALNTGDEAQLDECFHPDFKMIVPGTGGTRESKELPLPPGSAGKSSTDRLHSNFKDLKRLLGQSVKRSVISNGQFKR